MTKIRQFGVAQFLAGSCTSCHQGRGPVCAGCVAGLDVQLDCVDFRNLSVARALVYEPPISHLIIAYKDRGEWSLRSILARLLARSIAHLLLSVDVAQAGHRRPVLLVPIAATAASVRLRDSDPVADLATSAAGLLRHSGLQIRSQRILMMREGHRDHIGLSRDERHSNMKNAFTVRGRTPAGIHVVIVDDVVTTGATLTSAYKCLSGEGLNVLGAGVIAGSDQLPSRG